jgi:hypothetical protein
LLGSEHFWTWYHLVIVSSFFLEVHSSDGYQTEPTALFFMHL